MGIKYNYEYNKQNTSLLHVHKNIGTGRGQGDTKHNSEGNRGIKYNYEYNKQNMLLLVIRILFEIFFMISHYIASYHLTTLY